MIKNKDRWSALSMKERADLIKLYVSSGITSLDIIKKDYNSFKEGGNTNSEGVEEDIPTLDAYLQMKLQEARQMAIANSYNATEPRLAKRYYTEENLKDLQADIKYAERISNNYSKFAEETEKELKNPFAPEHIFMFNPIYKSAYTDTGLNDLGEKLLKDLSDERYLASSYKKDVKGYQDRLDYINEHGYDWTGYNCITNATGWYGDSYVCASNVDFRKEPSKYGFVEINPNNALPGDIFQYDDGERPYHATMYSKKGDDGTYYVNYANGDYTEAIRHDAGFWGKGQRAFRFVGLPEDIEAWTQEYNEKYKNSKEGTNNHSNGGKLNRFDIGGPTREMTPLEAAALNKTLNNSQYMLAVGDSPDDPAYLSTDYLEPAIVKAFNSNEEYNRYYGEQFGKQVAEGMNNAAPYVLEAAMLPFTISGAVETPMLLYQGAKALPQVVKLGKSAFRNGKKYFGKKVLGMVDDISKYTNADSHFRIVDKPAIDDAIESGLIRAKTGLHHDAVAYLKNNFSDYLRDIPGWDKMDANDLRGILESKGAFTSGGDALRREAMLQIRNSTNHGGSVHYFKGMTYPNYDITTSNYVIETPDNIGSFVAGHGGKEYDFPLGEFGSSLLKSNGSVRNASMPSKGSMYWEYSPFFEMWKRNKFDDGGRLNMYEGGGPINYLINNTMSPTQFFEDYLANYTKFSLMPEAPIDEKELARRQAWAESAGNDRAGSHKGAKGRYQIMPNTLTEYQKATKDKGDIYDPVYNRRVRDWEFNRYKNSDQVNRGEPTDSVKMGRRLAIYNYGYGNTREALNEAVKAGIDIDTSFDWLQKFPKETRDYVNFILRNKDTGAHRTNDAYKNRKK